MHKIVHISSVHPVNDTRIFVKECSSLAAFGYDVSYLVPNSKTKKKNGVNVIPLSVSKNKFLRVLSSWAPATVAAFKQKADIYHFHDPELIFMGFLLSLSGKNVVYDVHEDYELQILNKLYIPKGIRRWIAKTFKFFERLLIQNYKLVVTVTDPIKEKYKKIHPNVIDVKNYPLLEEFRNCRLSFDEKKEQVCYIGAISRIRGVFDYVNMLDYLPREISLKLGGDYSYLDMELEALPSWNRVEKMGYVDRSNIADVFLHSKVGLVVLHATENYIDALPVKVFEYMASGIPVICSNFKVYEDIVIGNDCGLSVEPCKPDLIAKRVKEILKDKVAWERMSNNGIRAVEQKYNWGTEALKLKNAYEKLLESK